MWDSRLENTPPDLRLPADEDAPPSVTINPHSELGKELRKWEQHLGPLTPPGTRPGNPYVFREFPKMLYRATRGENGQPACVLPAPHPWDYADPNALARAQLAQESWNTAHQRVVRDASEERLVKGQGWTESPSAALVLYEQQQQDIAEAAAQTAFQARRMSDLAQRELATAEGSTDAHVVDVQSSKKKRGRKPKAVTGTGPIE